MNRERAIEILNNLTFNLDFEDGTSEKDIDDIVDAINMAIEILAISSAESTKDLLIQIIRDILAMYVVDENGNQLSRDEVKCGAINIVKKYLRQLPSSEPKTGHWIDREEYDADRWKCSECGRTEQYQENYCPNCGCCMVDEQKKVRDKNEMSISNKSNS